MNPRPPGYEPDELPDCSILLQGGDGWIRTIDKLLVGFYRSLPVEREGEVRLILLSLD